MPHLTLHHRAHALRHSRLPLRALEQLDTGTDGNQWVAQLMGQHGNELILAAIRFAQLLLTQAQRLTRLGALDQVGRLAREHIQEPQLALGQALPLPPVRGDHSERPPGAAQQRSRLRTYQSMREMQPARAVRILTRGDVEIDEHTLAAGQSQPAGRSRAGLHALELRGEPWIQPDRCRERQLL